MQRTIKKAIHMGTTADVTSVVEGTSQCKFKYLKVLKVELQDIIEDMKMMIEICRKRQKSGEISKYVSWQNTALFIHEIKGLSNLLKDIDTMDPSQHKTLVSCPGNT